MKTLIKHRVIILFYVMVIGFSYYLSYYNSKQNELLAKQEVLVNVYASSNNY